MCGQLVFEIVNVILSLRNLFIFRNDACYITVIWNEILTYVLELLTREEKGIELEKWSDVKMSKTCAFVLIRRRNNRAFVQKYKDRVRN